MAKAYSNDLREKVMKKAESGMCILHLAKAFNIGRATIYRWLERKGKLGHVRPEEKWQKGHSHLIKDLPGLLKYVSKNPGKTLDELAQGWGEGCGMTIARALKKAGYTHKKNNGWIQGTQRRS